MKKGILLIISIILSLTINIKTANALISVNPKKTVIGINSKRTLDVVGNINEVKMESSDESIVSVAENAVIGKKAGIAYVTVTDGTSTAVCKVTVVRNYIPVTSLTLSKDSDVLIVKTKSQIIPKILPENASNKYINYVSSDESILSVDDNGIVTANKVGRAYISVSVDNKTKIYNVVVVNNIALKGISIPITLTLGEGNTSKLQVKYDPDNATNKRVTWKSSNTRVVTVDSNGNIKGISAGSAIITATSSDGSHVAKSNIIVTTIDKTLKSITLNKTELTLNIAEEETLTVNFNPSNTNNKRVTWKSSNENIAIVDSDGKIKAIKPGKVEIKAISDANQKEAICTVNVTSLPIKSISFHDKEIDVYEDGKATLITIPEPENTAIIDPIWESSNEEIATVDDGIVTAKQVGTTIISISNQSGDIAASITVNVIPSPEKELSVEIAGYDLNFNQETRNYTLTIGDETSLDIKVNRDSDKYIIAGNRDLKNGSIITITINDPEKETYIINIKKKLNPTIYLIAIIAILIIINIVRVANKKK